MKKELKAIIRFYRCFRAHFLRHADSEFMSSLANSSWYISRSVVSCLPTLFVCWCLVSCETLTVKFDFFYRESSVSSTSKLRPSTKPMGLHCQETVVGSCTWAVSVWSDALCIKVFRIIAQIKESSGYMCGDVSLCLHELMLAIKISDAVWELPINLCFRY